MQKLATLKLTIQYFALLRDERGLSSETVEIGAGTAADLYAALREKYRFSLAQEKLRVAVNDSFVPWDQQLREGDRIVFIPPVAGG